MIKRVKKVWGVEYWLVNEPEYCAKILEINPGYRCSLHYHPNKKETFTVMTGRVLLEQKDIRGIPFEELLLPNDSRTIWPKTPHRFSSEHGAEILEVSTHHDDSDVVRITESGRIPNAGIPDASSSGPTKLSQQTISTNS